MASITSTTLPAFVAALLEGADEVDERVQIGGSGEDFGYLARIGSLLVTADTSGHQLMWYQADSEDDAREKFAAQVASVAEIYAYAARPDADMRVIGLMGAHGLSLERAEQIVRISDMTQTRSAPAVGRASVPTGTVYEVSSALIRDGMYL